MTPAERARERLRHHLERDVWTQREFAQKVGKSQPWLVKILSGENSLRLDDLDIIALALRIPPAELIREAENEIVEVTPSELRALRGIRALESEQVTHLLAIIDMAVGQVAPPASRRQTALGFSPKDAKVAHDRPISEASAAADLAALRGYLNRVVVDLGAASAGQIPDRPLPSAGARKPEAG